MIVKRNRLLDESQAVPTNGIHVMTSQPENNSSPSHFGQQQQQQDMTFGTLRDSSVNDENDEENIVIDMVDEDEDDEDDNDDGDDDADDEAGARREFMDAHHQARSTRSNQHRNRRVANVDSLSSDGHNELGDNDESRDTPNKQQRRRQHFSVGDLIWFDPNQLGYAIPGKVIDFYPELNVLTVEGCCQPLALEDPQLDETTRNRLLVKADEQLQVYELSSDLQSFKSIRFRQPIGSQNGVANLIQLGELSTESIIWNLKLRFKQNLIYTKCGHKILVSVNPYKQLSELYDLDQVNQYDTIKNQPKLANLNYLAHNKFIRWLTLQQRAAVKREGDDEGPPVSSSSSQPASGDKSQQESSSSSVLAPHLFELANEALKKLLIQCQDQCFILLGDSGSGKTEAAKLLVQYFATVNKSPTNLMTEQILESIQMLESFGNAKTVLNNNSSRFGRLLEIRFSLINGFIQDARTVDLNLLDRSRIVCQNEGERNFNIFYELLAGLSKGEKEKYGLQTAEKYFYLNQGHCVELAQKEDGEDFRSLLASMQVLGFTYEEQDTIFRVLASILHLGNIYFHRKVLAIRSGIGARAESHLADKSPNGGDGGVEGVEIGSDTEARWVSHLLKVQFDLVMRCLTVRTVEMPASQQRETLAAGRGPPAMDCIATPLNIDQALDTRDAIARALYTCLFKWLVQRINLMINAKNDSSSQGTHNGAAVDQPSGRDATAGEQHFSAVDEEPIYLCRTSESLCEFQPDKLVANRRPTLRAQQSTTKQSQQTALISILDAFGFENLAENNFEQLCINYAAELLHYHTNRYLIRLEQAEYARERIQWQPMATGSSYLDPSYSYEGNARHQAGNSFGSNSSSSVPMGSGSLGGRNKQAAAIVNLISKKPLGILNLLDDECNFPKATDQSFAEKCHHNHALNENYQCARLVANCQEFGIRHFRQASRMVWYQVDGFIEKNRDSLRPDVMELLLGSKMTIVADMLRKIHKPFGSSSSSGNDGELYAPANSNNGKTLSRTYDGRYVSMKPRAGTVAARFQDTLNNNRVLETLSLGGGGGSGLGRSDGSQQSLLMNGINNNNYITRSEFSSHLANADTALVNNRRTANSQANTWFIVCLKPNRTKSAQIFDVAYVQEQVRSMNLLELVHMRKFGFPVRLRYGDFLKRYKCLVTRKFLAASCGRHLKQAGGQQQLPQHAINKDDDHNHPFDHISLDRSSHRSSSIRRAMRNVCSAILELKLGELGRDRPEVQQQHFQCGLSKMFLSEWLFHQLEDMRLLQYNRSILIIQKTWAMWLVRREFLDKRRAAIVIQAHLRGHLARRQFLKHYSLVVRLQRRWRRVLSAKRAQRLETRRRLLRQQQQQQLHELQMQQSKQANQLRFRLQAPARATDKTLDIPEDLAQLYRLQRNWLPSHDLTNVNEFDLAELMRLEQTRIQKQLKTDGRLLDETQTVGSYAASIPFVALDNDQLESIASSTPDSKTQISRQARELIEQLELDERYSIHALLTRYFSNQAPQFGYSRLPITRPFSWSRIMHYRRLAIRRVRREAARWSSGSGDRASTRSSLPKEQSIQRRFVALEQKAVAVYKLILRYIDSDQLFKLPDHLEDQPDEAALVLQRLLKFKLISDYINYLCLVEPLLRDEVYLQLISQTWQNPKLKSQENCWKLMLNCLACFDPLDSRLVKHLIGYASEYCCVTYKRLVCERLLECHNRLTDLSRRAGGRKRMILAAINSVPIAIQRQFPTTILECWANQQATDQLAISGSCYMDEQLNSSSTQASADSANQQQHQTDDRRQVCQIEQPKDQLQDITNYSNQTVALVSSRSTAEQLAHRLLSSRGVPDSNLVGWSVEIQHEGALSEFSSRLRGDDHLFDHLARLELLPELVQLIDDDLEALECEQLDELGLGGALGDHGGPDLEAAPQLESDLPSCCRNASPVPAVDDCCRQASVARSNYSTGHQRLSVHSQGSWDLNSYQGPQSPLSSYRRRHSAAMSELDLQMGGEPGMFSGYNHHAANHPDSDYYGHSHYSQQPSQHQNQRMNRRSMSMQELLLATSSALNGRYFMQQHAAAPPSIASGNSQLPSNQQQHYAASCLSSNCCGPPASGYLPRSRRHSGSLRQLDQSRQGSYAPSAGYYQARRRSTTPNSMISNNRLSASSAYGSHSSRFNQAGATGNQPMVYGSKQAPVYMSSARSAGDDGRQQPGQHSARNNEDPRYGRSRLRAPGHNSKGVTGMPGSSAAWSRRSASTSSRGGTGVPGNSNKPSSDYASAHSDYEQITHPHHQQQQQGQPRPQPGAGRSGRQQADPLGDSNQRHRRLAPMNKQPVPPTGKASSPNTHSQAQYLGGKSSASVHYAATSSAMSDTSEAPSLASHVRRIKVPQPNGDLDKYLDDLFNPLLDGADLDELSDARSMATSIRGVGRDDLSALCDPVQLSRIIRGTDEPKETDDQELQNQLQRAQTLSPTFESLLRSLKSVNESELKLVQGDQLTSTQHQHQQKTGPSLDELNLSQLKALNEKLESEIQAAQSARASLELTPGPSGFGDIMESPAHVAPPIPPPIPPPQPSFSHLPVTSAQLQTEQLIDDIYSRAKTIRIGKWRWPPALTEQEKQQLALSSDTPVDENKPDINDKLVQERRLSADTKQDEAKLGHKEEDEHGEGTRHQQDGLIAANSTSVGRLKISSEMKAKLEQLTNSSGSSQEPTTTGSTGSSDCKSTTAVNAELDAGQYQQPKRLDDQRRNLLASQLLGAKNNSATGSSTPEESPSRRDSGLQQPVTGSKVLAVKQQLAAAAGVALSALDSSHSGASSQTSSRRQSSCQPNNDQQRRLVLEADELGPQSRGAINQRQAFYLNDEVEDPRRRSLLKDEESIKSSECTSRATSKQIAANPSGANQSTPATNELGGSGGGAKNLNTCLLKHKQEISQAKTMGQKEADNETRSGYASGQWVSSSSSSSCLKDKQSVDEIRTGRHPERQSLVAATTTTTNTSKRKQAEQVETSDQGPQQQQQLASQKRTRPIACLAYANVDWQVRVRKEVFKPSESYDNELVVQLVFAQLVADVFNPRHWTRLNNKERAAIKSIMKDNSIGYAPSLPGLGQMQAIKRELVRMARSFGLYFTRSYQALNFACLSETYLDAFGPHELNGIGEGGSMDGSSDDSDTADLSDDSSSSSSASSLFGPEHKQRQGDETRPARASARLALKLAHRLRSSDRLGLDWIDMVAVHHSGLRLVALVCDQTAQQQDQRPADRTSIRNSKQFIANQIGVSSGDAGGPPTPPIGYKVLETLKFRDMTDVRLVSERVLLVSMRANGAGAKQARHKSWLVSSSQANQLAALLRDFLADYNKNVRASSSKSASADCAKRQEQTQWAQTDDRRQPQGSDEFSKHQQFKASKTQLVGTRLPGDQRGRIHESSSNDNRRQDALLATDDAHDGDHLKQRQTANSIDKLRKTANPNNVLADTKRALSNDLAHSHASASPSNTSGSGHSGPGKQSGSNRSGSGGPSGNQSSPTAALPSVDGHGKRPGSGSNDSTTTTRSTSSPIPAPGGNNSNKYRGEPGGGSDAGRGRPDHHSATSITNATNNNQDDTAYPVEQQQYERAHSSNESLDEQQQPSESQLNNTASKQNRERPPAPEGDSGGQLIGGAQGKKRQTAPTNTTTTTTTTTTRSGKQSSSGQSLWQNSLSRMSNRFSLFGGVHSSAASTFKHQFGAKKNKKRLTSGEPPAQDEAGDQLATSRQPDVVLDAWIEAKMDFGGEDDELQDESTTGLDSSATQHGPLNMLSSSSSLSSPKANDVNNKNQDNSESGLKSGSRKDSETASRSDQKQYGSLVAGSNQSEDNNNNNNNNDAPTKSTKADDGKYSMLQFALYNFREAIDKYSLETRLSINNSKQPVQAPHDDWSTLRGSLKLIESLRTRSDASTHNNSSSSQSTISSTKTLTKMVANEHQQQQQQQQQRADSGQQAPSDWTWRELAQMVKYTSTPLKRSLLKLSGGGDQHETSSSSSSQAELERRAIDCFAAIMRYMGDLKPSSETTSHKSSSSKQHQKQQVPDNEVECVYLILINCHNHPQLRDEVYCQLIKQTTNNRSAQPDSCLRGWRLFSLLAAYFDCSARFRPYLLNYLEQNAFDKRRSYHSIALLCLQNLRKTFKCGGRKNVPSIEEIAALSAGRISKRQIYRLPGGTERVINTKSTTVVDDIIHEICSNMLMITQPNEMLEFSLYCIADGDSYTMPLNRDEYILDITTELIKNHQQYFLIFCRSVWHYPLRLDSKFYIEVTFNQIAPDYLEGLFLVMPRQQQQQKQQHNQKRHTGAGHYATSVSSNSSSKGGSSSGAGHHYQSLGLSDKLIREIARLGALLHRASSTDYMPHKDEIKYLLPRPIVASIKQQLKTGGANGARAPRGEQQLLAAASGEQTDQAGDSGQQGMMPDQQTWTTLVQDYWREMSAFDALDAKAQFLDIIRHWPLFGSSFFAIKLIQRDLIQPLDYILALNKFGIQMLDMQTHETHQKYSFNEVISTRKVRSEDGALYLDMKCGNLLKRTIIRIQTDQAHEISRLVRQYIDIELSQASSKQQQQQQSQQSQQPIGGDTESRSSLATNDNQVGGDHMTTPNCD